MADPLIPAYDVLGDWADLSKVPEAGHSWAHHGVVVSAGGEVIGFHAGQLVAFDNDGNLLRVVPTSLTEGHGITLVREGDEEFLWICDPGFVMACGPGDGEESWTPLFGKGVHRETREPRVVKMTLGGEVVAELPIPPVDSTLPGVMGQYCPCGSAVDEERFGGNGDVWVADGYGSNVVHRFDKHGNHIAAITGAGGGGQFNCPHAVFIDRRAGKAPELYIADRGNQRIEVYDLDGKYLRSCGAGFLNSPSGFTLWGELLVVAELYARLALLDLDDNLVGYLGADPAFADTQFWPEQPGWPNALTADGHIQAPNLTRPDLLNSPHAVAVDTEGNLYVSEWLIGGRYTKFAVRP